MPEVAREQCCLALVVLIVDTWGGSNYRLFSKDKSLVFVYVRLRHRRILLWNYCLRLPRSVRSTQVREAEATLISVAVYGNAAASPPVFR